MKVFNKFRKWKLDNNLITTILQRQIDVKVIFTENYSPQRTGNYNNQAWGKAYAVRSDGKYLCLYTSNYTGEYVSNTIEKRKLVKKWIDPNNLIIID